MGYSEGPGTFRGFLTTQQDKQLRFDPMKEPQWRSQQMGPDAEAKTEPVENTGSSVEAVEPEHREPEHREPAERTKEEESTEAGSSTVTDLSNMD